MWFNKKKEKIVTNVENQKTTRERMLCEQLLNADDEKLFSLAKQVLSGSPVLINFVKLSIEDANKFVAFMSGVVYAIGGHTYQFKFDKFNILFGDKDLYIDGSITTLIDKLEGSKK